MKKQILITLYFLLLTASISVAQTTYEPLYSDVYTYLVRLANKGVIEFNNEIKPLSRKYILDKLLEVKRLIGQEDKRYKGEKEKRRKITNLEIEELEFFLRDYNLETALSVQRSAVNERAEIEDIADSQHSNIPTLVRRIPIKLGKDGFQHSAKSLFWLQDNLKRYRLFSYSDKLFKLNLDPILGYEIGKQKGESFSHLWNGARFYGYVSDWLGFGFDFRDNSIDGANANKGAVFSPETGYVISRSKINHFEYEHTNTYISASWGWGNVSIGKEPITWGYGESGLLVHSTRAPSYPLIRLDLTLTPWLRFNYFHGWLSSDVIDSNASYSTLRKGQTRIILRKKFIASHTFIITPLSGLSLSLGESVIYSDNLEPLYLFPLMFFRAADHYLSNGKGRNNAGANSQFFFGISSRNQIPNTHLYGTFFIDEIRLTELFNPEKQRTQMAFQVGASVVDLPIANLTLTAEYTKLYPFVYRHYIPTQTYANHDYVLGDWIEHNADRIYASLNYRILRGLQTTIWGEYIRKGGNGKVDDQYIVPQPPFLFGLRKYYTRYGAEIKYEIVNDFFIRARYNNFTTTKELQSGGEETTQRSEFYFAVYYGI